MSSVPPEQPRPADRTRNRLLGALVALMALACVFLALLLASPRSGQPTAPVTVTAAPATAPGAAHPTTTTGQVQLDAKGYGRLGDIATRTANDPLAVGRPDAPVVVVEFADYKCPFCAVWARDQQRQILDSYVKAGTVRVEWRDFVIFGEQSTHAALAARAAGRQGRFWQYHDTLFAASPTSGHPDLTDVVLRRFATQAGVPDMARWDTDRVDPALAAAVQKDTAQIAGLGANSTPVFVVNGVPLVGAQPMSAFSQVIDAALDAQKKLGKA